MNRLYLSVVLIGLAGVWYTQQLDAVPQPKTPTKPAPIALSRSLRIYTTSGCVPCSRLKESLASSVVRDAISSGNWKVDEITSRARAAIARVRAFPTIIASIDDNEVGRKDGFQSPAELSSWLKTLTPAEEMASASVGGPKHEDGTEVICDLPADQHCENVSSRGEGCCTQTSVNHAARWQNVPALIDFHKWVQEKGLSGGGSPGTMRDRIPRCCKDRGYPVVPFIQVENASHEVLKAACRTGRMVSCTYSKSPTGRYKGRSIAHMVNCVHADDKHVVILDNNYIGEKNLEWLTPEEAKRAGVYEWLVILLAPPPPPVPIARK